ncbi:Hypothetical protein HVR_LOCUS126 [uncultured virus]|nr:Hypothetical protein HVR_LOCUS126 [uncultured virus]
MNVTYVSALYKIYAESETTNILINNVRDLLNQPLNIVLYVDEFYYDIITKMDKSSSVSVVLLPMKELHIYNMIIENKKYIKLPTHRTPAKDNHEYLALMNTKIEFLYRAKSLITTKYAAWIDAGCSKLFKEKEKSFDRLVKANIKNIDKLLIPGCCVRNIPLDQLCNNVHWVFIGTFFIINSDYISEFYNLSLQSTARFLLAGYISWEVNTWVDIVNTKPDIYKWYYSGHDDKFTEFPEIYLQESSQTHSIDE